MRTQASGDILFMERKTRQDVSQSCSGDSSQSPAGLSSQGQADGSAEQRRARLTEVQMPHSQKALVTTQHPIGCWASSITPHREEPRFQGEAGRRKANLEHVG